MQSLKVLDGFLVNFATTHNLKLSSDNPKGGFIYNFEERSLRWESGDLSLLIQIFPNCKEEKIKYWVIWIVATADKTDGRYWWRSTLLEGSKSKIISSARVHIAAGYQRLQKLSIKDLDKV